MAVKLTVEENQRATLTASDSVNETFNVRDTVEVVESSDYADLLNKPRINDVELVGNKTTAELGIEIPTKLSQLDNDEGFITDAGVTSWNGETGAVTFTETDPTVPNWAKQPTKPTYTAQEVGALPNTTVIPTKTSQLTNDSNFVSDANYVHTDNNFTNSEKSKLSGIEAGAEVNVNADWNATSGDAQILNKPSIPTKTSDLTNDSNFITASGAPVQSVNGQTGAVNIAIPTVPANVSAFTNDSGYVNATQAAQAAPVQSVNGDTGAVILDASDVGALPDSTTYAASASVGGNATRANGILYGECDSTSTATVFTATVAGVTEYYDGLAILLKNGVVTSASGFTLNINGLGAKASYSNMTTGNDVTPTAPTRDTTIFNINYTMLFIYNSTIVDGGGWICYRGYDTNTNTIGYQIRSNSSSLPVSGATYRYRLLFTSADGTKYVPANTGTSTNATAKRDVDQTPIDPFGRIVYYGYTTAITSGNRPGVTYLFDMNVLSLGYSFNRTGAALTLTSWKPVYVKCAPQSDGSVIMDADTPYVQALPTAYDGKVYIYLGSAYSATNIELMLNHPVYYIDSNGRKRVWTGEAI